MTGIPIFNVNNNCATGSTALFLASQFISGGITDCALALGFEKMERGSLPAKVEQNKWHIQISMIFNFIHKINTDISGIHLYYFHIRTQIGQIL